MNVSSILDLLNNAIENRSIGDLGGLFDEVSDWMMDEDEKQVLLNLINNVEEMIESSLEA